MTLSTSTKALLLAGVVLVLLFVVGDRFGMRTNSVEPRTFVMELDTSSIVRIGFQDRANSDHDLLLQRTPTGWTSESVGASAKADIDSLARELMGRFQRLKVKRDMGMIRLLGERYALTESTMCRITFTDAEGGEQALNMGSSTFAPGKVGAWTYVNVPGEKQVYAVEAALTKGLRPAAMPDR